MTALPERVADDGARQRLSNFDGGVARFTKVPRPDRRGSKIRRQHRGGVSQLSGERRVRRQRREGSLLAQRHARDDRQHDAGDGDRRHQLDEGQSTAPSRGAPGQHGKRVRRTTTCGAEGPNTMLSLISRVCPSTRDDQNSAEAARTEEPEPAVHGDARICSILSAAPITAAERARISFRFRTTTACVCTIPRIATSTRSIATSSSRRENPYS